MAVTDLANMGMISPRCGALAPQRDKALKTIRRYAVEVVN
jgi:hypothetical protein